jgi:hypothetical protein
MVAQVGYSVAERSRGRVAPCAVCTMHMETRSTCFLVELQNQGQWFVSGLTSKPLGRFFIGLGLKTTRTVFTGLASKLVAMVSGDLASKPAATVSGGLASKPAATVSSGLASKTAVTVSVGLTSKLVMTVSPVLASKPVVGFLFESQNQGGGEFPGLGLKIGSYSLVIYASKSL